MPTGLLGRGWMRKGWHQGGEDTVVDAQGGPVDLWIERADVIRVCAGFFRHHFECAVVVEVIELPALAPARWPQGELGHGWGGELDINVRRLFDAQPFIEGRIPFSSHGQFPAFLKSNQRLFGLAADGTVNRARGKAAPSQRDLQLHCIFDGPARWRLVLSPGQAVRAQQIVGGRPKQPEGEAYARDDEPPFFFAAWIVSFFAST